MFDYLPDELQRAEDSTAVADKDRVRGMYRHTRPATTTERQLLAHLGYTVPTDLDTVVSWPVGAGVRRRTWPQLETETTP
ncbi:MAG: hypothetical protein NTW76_02080 [Corynebacteriales bacterium]|nr:hypothetical protein [Mycobacteriales bacterium]